MSQFTRRASLAGAGALIGAAALAQTPPPAAAPAASPIPAAPPPSPRVALTTSAGVIVVELATDKAPITGRNFLRYVDAKRFDGVTFYRALKLVATPLAGLIQGGVKNNPVRSFPPIAHESTRTTGLSHKDGALSMARYAPGTAASEFFICVGDLVSLDADPSQPGDNEGFAAFGHVTEGMDVVRTILTSPVSPTKGEASLKGQMLEPEVTILTARRLPA